MTPNTLAGDPSLFLPQPLPAPPEAKVSRYIPTMTTANRNRKHKLRHTAGVRVAQAQETFWDYSAQEAVHRVGRGSQLKGVIHEVVYREKLNHSPDAFLRGNRTRLTRSSNASTVDLVTTRDGRVVERLQAKDCISDSCARRVQNRVANGQYRTARLVGTRETVANFRAGGVSKRVRSSRVSSRSTTRAADNVGAKVPNKNLIANNMRDIAGCAGRASVAGAAFAAGAEAVSSFREMRREEINGAQYVARVASAGTRAGLDTAVRTTLALGTKEAVKASARSLGAESAKRFAGSNPGTAVAFGVAEQMIDTIQLIRGSIDGRQYGARSVQTAASTGGAIAGAASGAAIGSVIPGVGTVVGGVIGGVAGSISGGSLGRKLGAQIFRSRASSRRIA